ncbi:MAG: carbohydrate binding family 9 domain-containing protein [Pseudomonadales bacterium]|nr:carbohydrate binding family 9 domain-containing protein [Pseudomonadales bacterium]MCP5357958.1 carbohydrate binding family 9 domain-containing protein [Pseudomonadales bacterium]
MSLNSRVLRALSVFFLSLLLPLSSLAQELAETSVPAQKRVRAVRVDTPPVIDGKLDEAVWQLAEPITDFHQIRPGNQTAPSEATEVYVLYDDDALYIGARMADREPGLIAAPVIRHGQGLGSDDRLVVILDPFNTRRTGYRFETNLNAVRHDALYTSVNSFQLEWNTIWDTATSTYDNGWIAELEIPFKSLPFDPSIDTWGFNFGRGIRRRGEEMAWVSYNRTYNPSISGVVTGLEGMNQGLGLDVVPSFSMNRDKQFDLRTSDTNMDPSLDVFYRLTPSLNAALTINTDFSATEVDNRQVNLTRFNLFFPEKRDFFLNDSDLFQFGGIGGFGGNSAESRGSRENARPYFSRKLGLSQTGAPVDIRYGGRISGRVGRWNIGTLAIRQDEFGTVDASDLLISRVSANVLRESSVGFILTDGDPASNLDNSVYGMDFRYLNTRLSGGQVLEADAWFQKSDTPGLNGDDEAYGLGLRSPNNTGLRGGVGFKEVQRNFNPAMGYINRSNIRDYTADVGYTHFFRDSFLQSAYFGVDAQRINVIDGGLQSQVLAFRLLELDTNTRDRISLGYQSNKEVVLRPFAVYRAPDRSVFIPAGSYSFDEASVSLSTAGQREFSGRLSLSNGDFYNGKRNNINGSLSWTQSRNFVMSMSYDWNDITLPQGDFITRLTSLSTQVAFSSTLYWVSLVQYDNLSEEIGVNTRIQWIPRAGQEGFIVLNYNLQDRDKNNSFEAASSDLAVKFKYTFRF